MRGNTRRRRIGLAVAASAIAAVGLVCGWLTFANGPGPAAAPANPTGLPSAAATGQPPSAPPATPANPDSTEATLVPEDLTFEDVAGVRLPVSPTAGPRERAEGLAGGFARSPAGAALAASHILVRLHPQVGADVFGPTLAGQVVGPHADTLAANVQVGYEQLLHQWPVAYGQPAGGLHMSLPGYRIDTYTDAAATVVLLFEVPDGGATLLGVTSLQMRWHDGDWALQAPAGGAFGDTAPAADTGGFHLWGTS